MHVVHVALQLTERVTQSALQGMQSADSVAKRATTSESAGRKRSLVATKVHHIHIVLK